MYVQDMEVFCCSEDKPFSQSWCSWQCEQLLQIAIRIWNMTFLFTALLLMLHSFCCFQCLLFFKDWSCILLALFFVIFYYSNTQSGFKRGPEFYKNHQCNMKTWLSAVFFNQCAMCRSTPDHPLRHTGWKTLVYESVLEKMAHPSRCFPPTCT